MATTSSSSLTLLDSSNDCSSYEEEESSETTKEPVVQSFLDRLKPPTSSILSRKRSVHYNPPKGKKRCSGTHKNDPKSVSPAKRVSEFSGEHLIVSAGRLFCNACRETLSLK